MAKYTMKTTDIIATKFPFKCKLFKKISFLNNLLLIAKPGSNISVKVFQGFPV